MTPKEKQLAAALQEMLDLWDDVCKSNNLGKMCFHDYQRLNEAPMRAREAMKGMKP